MKPYYEHAGITIYHGDCREVLPTLADESVDIILTDPPYSEKDAESYAPGAAAYPKPNLLLKNCIDAVRVGGRVGMIGYIWASPPKKSRRRCGWPRLAIMMRPWPKSRSTTA